MVTGTCKVSDGNSGSRFCNAETNTESTTMENDKTSSSLKVPPSSEKQEYPALTKFFHRKFMKGHSVESDRVSCIQNNVAFRAQMPEQLKYSSVTCGIAPEAENSSVSSVISSGDCTDSASPCCMNECCSPSSTITSDSSDPSANCKTNNKYKYSSNTLELKSTNGRNKNADQNFCSKYSLMTDENIKKMKDVDDILLGNLNTSSVSKMQGKLENFENFEDGDNAGQRIMSMLNLDLSSIKDDDDDLSNDNNNDIKQSKCWKSPEEVRLGYGRVAALAKHFSRLGDSGLIRIHGRGGRRGRSRPGLWRGVFKSVPDVSRMCLREERNWNCPIPGPHTLPQSSLDDTDSNSCSQVYTVGLGTLSYSMDHMLFGDSSEDLGGQDHYKSCEELGLQVDSAEFKMAGSGDKEFEKVARQYKKQEITWGLDDALYARHARSEENVQIVTAVRSKVNELHCSNSCIPGTQHNEEKHRAFVVLTSSHMPARHSKSEGSVIAAIRCVGIPQSLPLFIAKRPKSEDNVLEAGLSNGDRSSWNQQKYHHTENENHLRSCFKSESSVLPSHVECCRMVDCRPKSEDNILLLAHAQDRLSVVSDGNEVRRNSQSPSASDKCTNIEPEHSGHGFPAVTRCKQQNNYLNVFMCQCYYLNNFLFVFMKHFQDDFTILFYPGRVVLCFLYIIGSTFFACSR
jgi:hypothetical protein